MHIGLKKVPGLAIALSAFAIAVFTTLLFGIWPANPWFGVAMSVSGTTIGFIYVLVTQNRPSDTKLKTYRWAEQELIALGKIKKEHILDYHRSYYWGTYAGLGFSSLFIAIPLFLAKQLPSQGSHEFYIVFVGLALLSIATVALGTIDFVHANSLTPLLPSQTRFRLIDRILLVGGLAISIEICAAGILLSLISSWLSLISSLTALTLMITYTKLRQVSVSELQTEFMLSDAELKRVLEAGHK